ncbi:MAG TPA: SDR family oxidoreductase [Spirochaetia bacterium]|nr:SDR family oxidoreductase [Spirochaetia bacterium]
MRKIALITGAGTGIGKAAALALAEAGFDLVLAGRRAEPLEVTAGDAQKQGARVIIHQTDVSDPSSVQSLFDAVRRNFGRLDLLFNNAGLAAPSTTFEDIPFEKWQAVVNVNLTGVFLCSQEAFRIMKEQEPRGGRIINNGSISAHAPRPFSAPYTATKHAVSGLTRSCNLDGRAYDIAVGQIDIGNARTDMTETMTAGTLQPDGTLRPEPRMDVKHVADAIVQMAMLPLSVNILSMTIMATKMPFVGRG